MLPIFDLIKYCEKTKVKIFSDTSVYNMRLYLIHSYMITKISCEKNEQSV